MLYSYKILYSYDIIFVAKDYGNDCFKNISVRLFTIR